MRLFFLNSVKHFECSCYHVFSTGSFTKNLPIFESTLDLRSRSFRVTSSHMRSTESTNDGFHSWLETCFLETFPTEVYQSAIFYKHQNQLRPFSILSHTGGAVSGQPQLVNFVRYAFVSMSNCTKGVFRS